MSTPRHTLCAALLCACSLFSTQTLAQTQTNQLSPTGKVGIGTTSPSKELEVQGTTKLSGNTTITKDLEVGQALTVTGSLSLLGLQGTGPRYLIIDGSGKVDVGTSPAGSNTRWLTSGNTAQTGDVFGTRNPFDVVFITNSTERMRLTQTGTLRIGTGPGGIQNQLEVLGKASINKLAVGLQPAPNGYTFSCTGKMLCEEIEVRNKGLWPDYVFAPDYALRSFGELEQYIQTNRHLPGVTTAAEAASTINLAETNRQLLEKVEELTLYIIQLHKRIENLENAE